MTNNKRNDSFFSSFTFKIMAAMMLIAVIPTGVSLVIFDRIASFNQNLQLEAVESIDTASEVYRAWVNSESERMRLIEQKLSLEIDRLLEKHQIVRMRDVRLSNDFRLDLQKLFEKTVNEEMIVAGVQLDYNMEPVVKYGDDLSDERYKYQSVDIPVAIRTRYGHNAQPVANSDTDEMPMLVAAPVNDTETSGASAVPALPENLPSAEIAASTQGVRLSIVFAVEKAQLDLYETLGERRYLHGSISAMEKDGGMSTTEIYQGIFMTVSFLVILFAMLCAIVIALPMSRRISALTQSVKRIADGDLNAKVEVKGHDQISFLMLQFNSMVDDVRTAQESKAYIERMQAWREVARRLAHEIKNPLTPIVLAIQQLDNKFEDYTKKPAKYRKLLTDVVEIVNEETETLRKLVKNFTEFARMPIPEMKESCFYDFVVQTVQQNPQFAESSKRVTVHPASPDLSSKVLSFDPELMRRVIINIVRNGIEAAQNDKIDPEIDLYLDEFMDDSKPRVRLKIIDNGPGLTDEQKSKLFMPYFTTKSDGTGLGLSIVRKIVEDHNGRISLHDRDDKLRGTQVDIVL